MESVQQNYIGGTWVPAGATAPNVNPSNLNDVVANYARAQPAEAEAAIAAAKAAFSGYSRSTPQDRYEALKKVSDEILYPVHVMTRKSFGLMMRKLSVTESR